jgi:integrase
MVQKVKTRYPGVRYVESKVRRYNNRPERFFYIRIKKDGVIYEESVGSESQGMTAQRGMRIRGEIQLNIKTGQGPASILEMRRLDKERREAKRESTEQEARENIIVDAIARRYLSWAKENKKSWQDDRSRYTLHIAPAIGKTRVKDLCPFTLEKLKQKLKKKCLAPATVKHCLVLLRQIINRGISWGLYDRVNPVSVTARQDKKFLKNPDNRRTRFLSREEAQLLLEELGKRSQQTRDICELALFTGLRLGEIFSLTWANLDLRHEVIHIKDPKSGVNRTAYITPPLNKIFKRLSDKSLGKEDLVFKDRKGNKIREISNVFGRVVDRLGFNRGITDRRDKIVPHSMRHSFGSWLAMEGIPLFTVQKLLGHRSLEMVQRYAHLTPSHEREAAMRLVGQDFNLREPEKANQ